MPSGLNRATGVMTTGPEPSRTKWGARTSDPIGAARQIADVLHVGDHVVERRAAPAVLFEAGYISNVDDELLLRSPEYRAALVAGLAETIEADVAARSRR